MNEWLASFAATIAYGWLALAGLIAAGIGFGHGGITALGLLAAGASYLAQIAFTREAFRVGTGLQLVAVGLFLLGVLAVFQH